MPDMTNTPTYIYKELKKRGIKVEVVDSKYGLMRYHHKGRWHLLRGCVTHKASSVATFICNRKSVAEIFASRSGMPVPASESFESFDQALRFIKKHGSIAVKPLDAAHGYGISLNVGSKTELIKALRRAKKHSMRPPLLQQMVGGHDVRIMIIDGKYAAAVMRVPAMVTGDGKHTVLELIERENEKPYRSKGRRGRLGVISLDAAKAFLKRRLSKVPKKGEKVSVIGMGNTSIGGHAEDYTDRLPAKIYRKAEKFARELKLPVCGVDIMLDKDGKYHFIEANASPGFGPHHHPRVGAERDVTATFVDMILE